MTTTTVTREEAERVLSLVKDKYRTWIMTWPVVDGKMDFDAELVPVPDSEQPHLVENYLDEGNWAIVWESNGPYEWAYNSLTEASQDAELLQLAADAGASRELSQSIATVDGAPGQMPKGVYAEAHYSFVLVLYKEV